MNIAVEFGPIIAEGTEQIITGLISSGEGTTSGGAGLSIPGGGVGTAVGLAGLLIGLQPASTRDVSKSPSFKLFLMKLDFNKLSYSCQEGLFDYISHTHQLLSINCSFIVTSYSLLVAFKRQKINSISRLVLSFSSDA